MMARLGFVARVALIVLVVLGTVQLMVVGFYYAERDRATDAGFRLPLPDQAAAMIALLDGAGANERALLLRALNGTGLGVEILADRPAMTARDRAMPQIEATVRRYLAAASPDHRADRPVSVWSRSRDHHWSEHFPRLRGLFGQRLRIITELRSGGYLEIEAEGDLASRVLGLPVGFFAGLVGFLAAGLALLVVAREMRPLSRLAKSVESFGTAGAPAPVAEAGAREVRVLIRAVNRMQDRIGALLESRRFVLGALSHDLGTFLTRLRLRIALIPDQLTRERADRDIEDMQALVEDALAFAKASFGTDGAGQADLARIVRREVEENLAMGKAVTLEAPAEPVRVPGSALALGRVIANLIDNAVKYGGEAIVSLRLEGTDVVLRVEDRGPGIPSAERERIFEPFQRIETSRNREQGGAGLGLAIARQVIGSLGGRIGASERAGGGACIWFSLPRRA